MPPIYCSTGSQLRDRFGIERPIAGLTGEAQEIPRRIDECIERIGFAKRRLAALWTIDMLPRRMARQWIAGGLEIDIFRQDHRQLLLAHRHYAARLAMDERDGRAPVPLARNAPVAQPVLRLRGAPAFRLGARDDGRSWLRSTFMPSRKSELTRTPSPASASPAKRRVRFVDAGERRRAGSAGRTWWQIRSRAGRGPVPP